MKAPKKLTTGNFVLYFFFIVVNTDWLEMCGKVKEKENIFLRPFAQLNLYLELNGLDHIYMMAHFSV